MEMPLRRSDGLVNQKTVLYGTDMKTMGLPMCSRRELRRQDRREAILAVAAQSFLERGYAGTTMSGIAATLGGSKGTLWSYFPSKEELFAAVIDQKTIAFRAHLSEILDPQGELGATLKSFYASLMAKVTSPDAIALHRLVVAEAGRFPEMGVIFYERAPQLTHQLLADYLAGAMVRGVMRQGEPMVLARMLTSLCLSGCHQQLLVGLIDRVTPDLIAADVDRAVDMFLRAYAVDASQIANF
jgi:TetR/AcrR family transcriptional repressor of mexJK operon